MKTRRAIPTSMFLLALSAVTFACSSTLLAHAEDEEIAPHNWHELMTAWTWEPGSTIALALSAILYIAGLRRLWRNSGIGHGVKRWEAWCFAAGWFWLFIALLSPLHPWGSVLFSAHMIQHEILMLISAPLLVLGRPLVVFLKALPAHWAHGLGRLSNTPPWRSTWHTIANPLVAWFIHGIVIWAWHAPLLFQATLHNDWIHASQHASFLLSAMLFWWALIHCGRNLMGYGAAVLYMFTTALHTGVLGAILSFAGVLWYPAYAHTTQSWGLTPLQDEQIGGLIMWIPAGVVYIIAGLALMAGWLRESERRAQKSDRLILEGSRRSPAVSAAPEG